MCPELESDRSNRERNQEIREVDKESRDNKELQAAAAMERADFLNREVKTSQNQMQNIVRHMQAVLQAIKQLRAALALPDPAGDENSLHEDQKRLNTLRARVAAYKEELVSMKEQLVQEHIKKLQTENSQTNKNISDIEAEVRAQVEKMYAELNMETD